MFFLIKETKEVLVADRLKETARHLQQICRILRVIANPIRLRILYCLREEEQMNVTDLTEKLNCRQAVVSLYLAKMVKAGIIGKRKEGRFHYYYVKNRKVYDVLDCLSRCVRK